MNQAGTDHVLKLEHHPWLRQTSLIYDRLEQRCQKNHIEFCRGRVDAELIRQCTSRQILACVLFDLIDDLDTWRELDQVCATQGRDIWMVTDNIIDDQYLGFGHIKIKSYHQLLGAAYHSNHVPAKKIPKKLFNCFIQRADPVRQSWFYLLHTHDLLPKGYVSFLLWQPGRATLSERLDLFDELHHQHGLDQLPHFDLAYRQLRPTVPYRNFCADDLLTLINECKYSLILETYATDDDWHAWCFTEKLMRSLQTGTVNLPFVARHGIKKLQDLGLILDQRLEAIDCLPWQQRQLALIDILDKDTLEFDADHDLETSMHNSSLIGQWQQQYQRHDFFDELFDEIFTQ